MNRFFNYLLVVCWAGLINLSTYSQDEVKVLFIGNSHTYTNDLPLMFKNIADSKGDTVQVTQSAFGGYQLYQHLSNQTTRSAITQDNWDYVVLQEGIYCSFPEDLAKRQSYPFSVQLYDRIMENSPTTQVILYMNQSYEYGTTYRCSEDTVVCSYDGMLERIKTNYLNMGNLLNVPVAPCALVWDRMIEAYYSHFFYSDDYYHPSPVGTYISACTIYSTIFNENPDSSYIPEDVDSIFVDSIYKYVNEIVLNDVSEWNTELASQGNFIPCVFQQMGEVTINIDEPFEYEIPRYIFIDDDTLTYTITGSTGLPDGLEYNPENLTISGTPVSEGSFDFVITAADNYGASVSDTLQIIVTSVSDISSVKSEKLQIFPNPANHSIKVIYPGIQQKEVAYKIIDLTGRTVLQEKLTEDVIDISMLHEGTYLLNLNIEGEMINEKIIIQ